MLKQVQNHKCKEVTVQLPLGLFVSASEQEYMLKWGGGLETERRVRVKEVEGIGE